VSSLLQRLAGHALGTSAPRIRSAERMRGSAQLEVAVNQPQNPESADPACDTSAISPRLAHPVRPVVMVPDEHDTNLDPRPGDRLPRTRLEHTTPPVARIERPLVPAASQALESEASFTTQETHIVVQAPTPLLGPVAPEVPRNPVASRAQLPSAPAAVPERDQEPTEVHVHIGRIEVTAVHTPAPVKRRVSTARQTQSLSEYLARRRPS
jgi:hypothetical protein